MTFEEMQEETFRTLRESGDVGSFYGVNDVKAALNDGYQEISDATEWFEESVGLPLMKDRPYYDLFSILGPIFLSIKPAFDENSNRWLIPSHVRELDDRDRRWERVQGTPQRVVMRGLRWMGLFPRTSADGAYVKLSYTRLPERMVDGTDEPGFPEAFHMGPVYYALADLFAEDGETALAVQAWKDYLEMETGLQRWVSDRTGRPIVRAMGALTGPR